MKKLKRATWQLNHKGEKSREGLSEGDCRSHSSAANQRMSDLRGDWSWSRPLNEIKMSQSIACEWSTARFLYSHRYVVKVDVLCAQCNDEEVMVNNGRRVKGQRCVVWELDREERKGTGLENVPQRKRADNEEELCIIKAGLNEICMQIHLSDMRFCCRLTMENNTSVLLFYVF